MPFSSRHHRLWHQFPRNPHVLTSISGMVFFFSIFNGIVAYLTPLALAERGFSGTAAGFIYAFSSIAGAIFDLMLERLFSNTHWKRMFLWMFVFATFFPIVLWQARTFLVFLCAMALWGIYYDFYTYGRFDYSGRLPRTQHVGVWGRFNAAQAAGFVAAPFLVGLVLASPLDARPYLLSFAALLIAFGIYGSLARKEPLANASMPSPARSAASVRLPASWSRWLATAKKLFPVLALTIGLNVVDSFFWMLGPLVSQMFSKITATEGILLSVYFLPSLMLGLVVGPLTQKFRKKKTAYATFGIGCAFLCLLPSVFSFGFFPLLILVFTSSAGLSLSWPALNGAYADYIKENPHLEKEIESTEDFASNSGYIIGPLCAGIFFDLFGSIEAFAVVGFLGVLLVAVLARLSPKQITFDKPIV